MSIKDATCLQLSYGVARKQMWQNASLVLHGLFLRQGLAMLPHLTSDATPSCLSPLIISASYHSWLSVGISKRKEIIRRRRTILLLFFLNCLPEGRNHLE